LYLAGHFSQAFSQVLHKGIEILLIIRLAG
jgi:hypothetical protein